MSYQLTVLYHHTDDAAAFDRYYDETHVPLAKTLPGLRSYSVSRPGPGPDGQQPPFHLVAVLTWDSAEAFQDSVGSAEGQKVLADVPNFATAGAEMLAGPTTVAV